MEGPEGDGWEGAGQGATGRGAWSTVRVGAAGHANHWEGGSLQGVRTRTGQGVQSDGLKKEGKYDGAEGHKKNTQCGTPWGPKNTGGGGGGGGRSPRVNGDRLEAGGGRAAGGRSRVCCGPSPHGIRPRVGRKWTQKGKRKYALKNGHQRPWSLMGRPGGKGLGDGGGGGGRGLILTPCPPGAAAGAPTRGTPCAPCRSRRRPGRRPRTSSCPSC
jgi:hypothetical protein